VYEEPPRRLSDPDRPQTSGTVRHSARHPPRSAPRIPTAYREAPGRRNPDPSREGFPVPARLVPENSISPGRRPPPRQSWPVGPPAPDASAGGPGPRGRWGPQGTADGSCRRLSLSGQWSGRHRVTGAWSGGRSGGRKGAWDHPPPALVSAGWRPVGHGPPVPGMVRDPCADGVRPATGRPCTSGPSGARSSSPRRTSNSTPGSGPLEQQLFGRKAETSATVAGPDRPTRPRPRGQRRGRPGPRRPDY
jgi:hypothetical protein